MAQNYHLPLPVQEGLQLVGQIIRYARKSAGFTLIDMAQKTDVGRKTLMRLEKGDANVGLGVFFKVLWILDIPLLQGINLGHRQSRTQLSLLLKSLSTEQPQRVRKKGSLDDNF